jgi:hypothetical protein
VSQNVLADIRGHIDGIAYKNGIPFLQGWVCDYSKQQNIVFHVYVDGRAGTGKIVEGVRTSHGHEAGVRNACNTPNKRSLKHRFKIDLSQPKYRALAGSYIYIHGISVVRGHPNKLIANSGKFVIPSLNFDRYMVSTLGHTAGAGVPLNMKKLRQFCGDEDGCKIRIIMDNWDGSQRFAMRDILFAYDHGTGNWRSESNGQRGMVAGTTGDHQHKHVWSSWNCYFTEGNYSGYSGLGDTTNQFFVYRHNNQYHRTDQDCRFVFID